jgi:hypothetical protein
LQHLSSIPQSRDGANAVLARVSPGYPPPAGRLLTCYAPVRHWTTPERMTPYDLHVLSAPPAFVLSQDQTLHELNSSCERTRLCSFGFFHVYVPLPLRTRRTCCLRLTPPRGVRLSTPKDPSCQNNPRTTDPLSIRIRPVSPGRRVFRPSPSVPPFVAALQSITLDSPSQGAAEGSFEAFRTAAFSATPSIYFT